MSHSKNSPLLLIAGPCVIEDEGLVFEIAQELKNQLSSFIKNGEVEFYFKASFDKANRTSIDGFRGPGMKKGLEILSRVAGQLGLSLITDIHTPDQVQPVVETVDFIQIPAFLCRQTDLVVTAAETALKHKKRLNIKKGQFLAPWDAKNIVEKVRAVEKKIGITPFRPDWFCLTERGTSFGYNTLVVDMISFQCMKQLGGSFVPIVYDATHSIQMPGGGAGGKSTGGKREYLEILARSAMAAGADGLFMECHPRPNEAKSDGPNAFYLEHVKVFIQQLLEIRSLVSSKPFLLPEAQSFNKEAMHAVRKK